jgi:glycosyltransferase 2 family protein
MWKRLLVIVVAIGLLFLALKGIQLHETLDILKNASWAPCFLALFILVVMTYLRGVRWSYLLAMQGYHYSAWNCFLVYMVSMFWGNVTPGRAGDFVKVLYLKKDLKAPVGSGMASVLVDRVLDLYLLLVMGGLGLWINPMPTDPDSINMIKAVKIFFLILLLISLLAFNKKIGGLLLKAAFQRLMKQEHREKTDKLFEDFHKGMGAFYKSTIFIPVFLSVVSYALIFGASLLMAQSIGLNINIFYLTFTISIVNIVSLLTLFGLGTRDLACQKLLGLVSIKPEAAEAFSLLIFFFATAAFTLVCFLFSFLKPIPLEGFSTEKGNTRLYSNRKKILSTKPRKPKKKR